MAWAAGTGIALRHLVPFYQGRQLRHGGRPARRLPGLSVPICPVGLSVSRGQSVTWAEVWWQVAMEVASEAGHDYPGLGRCAGWGLTGPRTPFL